MEKVPKKRAEWFALIEEFEKSNLSQINFCRQKGLILSRFTYYVQIYRKIKAPSPQRKTSCFSPVIVSQSPSAATSDIKIELPNGFRCQVASTIAPDILKKILGALLSC